MGYFVVEKGLKGTKFLKFHIHGILKVYTIFSFHLILMCKCIGDVMVTVQTKDYKIVICCFSNKNAALRSMSKEWLVGNRIMCLSGETCLPVDSCFSELAL